MKPTTARRRSRIFVLAGFGAVVACSDSEETDAVIAERAKPEVSDDLVPDGELDAADARDFSYSSVGKRDPFRSYLEELSELQARVAQRPIQATERFELDQYRLTGLVTGTSRPKALLEDPEGVGHTARLGSYVGQNGGVITRITSDGIVVTEKFRAPTGEFVKVPIAIKLPQPDVEIIGRR